MYNLSDQTFQIMSLITHDLWIVQIIAFLEFVKRVPYGKVTCFPHANNAWNTCDLHVCLNKNCTLFPHV